jgi:hypothetical protein
MTTLNTPTYNMYAIVKDKIVIDCGFGENTNKLFSPVTKKEYLNNTEFEYIQCTQTSGNFYIGQKIDEVN